MVYEMESHSYVVSFLFVGNMLNLGDFNRESMSNEDRTAGLAGIVHDLGYPAGRASPQTYV